MKIGNFTFEKRKWYYKNMQLSNPIVIAWKCIWYIPLLFSIAIVAILAAIFNLDISEVERVWKNNL